MIHEMSGNVGGVWVILPELEPKTSTVQVLV